MSKSLNTPFHKTRLDAHQESGNVSGRTAANTQQTSEQINFALGDCIDIILGEMENFNDFPAKVPTAINGLSL